MAIKRDGDSLIPDNETAAQQVARRQREAAARGGQGVNPVDNRVFDKYGNVISHVGGKDIPGEGQSSFHGNVPSPVDFRGNELAAKDREATAKAEADKAKADADLQSHGFGAREATDAAAARAKADADRAKADADRAKAEAAARAEAAKHR